MYTIYTDGGYSMHESKGGYAYVLLKDGEVIKKSAFPISHSTNNVAELLAIYEGVKALPDNCVAEIRSDSKYAIGVLSGTMKAVKNKELINSFHSLKRQKSVVLRWEWVKGHNGDKYNEMCDQMCNEVADMDLNAEFEAYRKKTSNPTKHSVKTENKPNYGNFEGVLNYLANNEIECYQIGKNSNKKIVKLLIHPYYIDKLKSIYNGKE